MLISLVFFDSGKSSVGHFPLAKVLWNRVIGCSWSGEMTTCAWDSRKERSWMDVLHEIR